MHYTSERLLQHRTVWLIGAMLMAIALAVPSAHATALAKMFAAVTPEDIDRLCQLAIERGEKPTPEGHLFLEFQSGGFRQYATLTLAQGLFGGFVGIERIDFIQEQWQITDFDEDDINQWVVSTDASGRALNVWHRHLLEEQGTILKEESLSAEEDDARTIVEQVAARFLAPILRAAITLVGSSTSSEPRRCHFLAPRYRARGRREKALHS